MLTPGDIAIVSGARTPMGRYCGKLKDFTAQELGAIAARGAIERAGIDPKEFDHVAYRNACVDSQSTLRVGHASDHQCGADGADRRSQDRAGGWDGSDVAGALRDSRPRRLHIVPGRETGRLADGRAPRYLLRFLHGEYRRTLRRAAGDHPPDAG